MKFLNLKTENIEYKKIEEFVDYIQPTKYIVKSTEYDDSHETPVLTPGKSFILGYTNEQQGIYDATKQPIILFDDFTCSFHWVNFKFKVKSSASKILVPKNDKCNFRYIYYVMRTLKIDIREHTRKWIQEFSQIPIPIPPLEVQNKIVEILDKFTNYEAELEAELEYRNKQYKYYRDSLFSNLKDVEYKTIEEISNKIFAGGTPSTRKSNYYDGDVLWLRSGEIKFNGIKTTEKTITKEGLKNSSAKLIKPFSVVIAMTGATVARCAWTEVELSANQSVCAIEVKLDVNYKFLYYVLSSKYDELKNSGKGVLTSLNLQDIKQIQIPIPPLEVQNKIVEILDKFSALVNDISDGIPKEIELRRKQYEYYRNKLLTFKEVGNV